ncbi:microcystin-dependent protein [Tahibacter aquaticus]|jgi:microcystin-dependent protein|uniref:Microcystin-dependent protein n=1 Tax=Tahibacter aquaticus TaxID=520092 RepID=A0A4R6Z4F1_9GAMM|nr:tail fiber protein [Tahibacter aquaticus]TDR46568.1 microcystin-dependent protein [Tahibacter aquaticus]
MADPFVAEIRIFGFNFAPRGWATCNGQLLPLSQNTALFSLLGTTYGGDGKSTFALPNMAGNAPMHWGQSTTGTEYFLGQESGTATVTLLQTEIPVHTHSMQVAADIATDNTPAPNRIMTTSNNGSIYAPASTPPLVQMNFQALSLTGSSLPHNNLQPYLTLTFCIALQGVFPARP